MQALPEIPFLSVTSHKRNRFLQTVLWTGKFAVRRRFPPVRCSELTLPSADSSNWKMTATATLNASDRRQEYARLRAGYDQAFQELIRHTRRHLLCASAVPRNTEAEAHALARVESALLAVRQRRDEIADLLREGGVRTRGTTPARR